MLKRNIKFSFSLFFVVCLTFGVSVSIQSAVAAWNAPSSNPVANNVPAPIFTDSTVDQTIVGGAFIIMNGATSGISAGIASFDSITTTGNVSVVGDIDANAFWYNSDKRLKKDILIIDSSLEKIMSLNGVNFKWKKSGEKAIGLIAQDVEKVFPELVKTNRNGLKSVQYGNLVAPLIESIKAQQIQIEELRKEVEMLKELR